MPTVEVIWLGQCPDHAVQQKLCTKMADMGEISNRLHQEYFGYEAKPISFDGQTVHQKVILSRDLFLNRNIPSRLEKINDQYFAAQEVSLYGVEFQVYDPRHYASIGMVAHCYTASFVFLRCADPELDGMMVQVYGVPSDHPLGAVGTVLLKLPSIDFRYYLEDWIAELLGWVKHFYVPDLYYCHWLDYFLYNHYAKYAPDDRHSRDEIFYALCGELIEEAEAWTKWMRKLKSMPDSVPEADSWLDEADERFAYLAWREKKRRDR